MRQFLLTILYFLLIQFQAVAGNNENYTFRHYTNKQGLSHNTVFCSLQDQRGFMWFGTEDGLNRFDGHTFKVYRYNARVISEKGLPGDRISNLFEDSTGKIWISTGRGVCYYDYETDTFQPLAFIPGQIIRDIFHTITEDNQQNLWFASYNRIVRFNPVSGEIIEYPASQYFHPITMNITSQGVPFFADIHSIYIYKPNTDRFTSIPILNEDEKEAQIQISAIIEVPQVGTLIGTDKTGVMLYHTASNRIEQIIPDIQVRAITAYNNNTFWIASESGVYIYNIVDKSIIHLQKSLTNEYTLADNAIYSITRDREGGMWVGAFFGGISYLPRSYTPFNSFIGGKTHPGMLGNAVREIRPDQYGNLWLGTEDNGINRYNPITDEMTNFSLNNTVHRLSATNIHGLLADGDRLWVGTYNKGIDVLDIPSGKIVAHFTQSDGLVTDFVLCFLKTRNQELLVGTGNGTMIYREETNRFESWQHIDGMIRQIYESREGQIWVATGSGLYRYNPSEDTTIYYNASDSPQKPGLGNNSVTSVFEDSKRRIWVTTTYGFSLYNKDTDSFGLITTDDGLPSNVVYRIVEDADGFFWISTANGLVKFDPETKSIRTFTNTDGLHETQFNYSSSYQSPDGHIYMGTINGMVSFNPQQFRDDAFVPPVHITRIQIPGDEKNEWAIQTLSSEERQEFKLPYNSSTFTLSYIALGFTSPEAIRYAYMLEGVDKEWIEMGNNKDVTFANLSPGKYVFKVRSTNSSRVWQDNEKALLITITPPFWATGWAFFFYLIVIAAAIIIFYNYKKKELEKRHRREQASFENEKEKELYNAKIQFFTFITHEIRTPLTLIKAPLERILQSKDGSPSTRKNLRIIENNTQRLLDLSNQLMDFRKTESRGFKLNFIKTDIPLWLDTILEPFLPVIENERKELIYHPVNESFPAHIDREAFAKIISNLMTNAIKYSSHTIRLELLPPSGEQDTFKIIVTNDGPLIPAEEKELIFSPFYRVKETENKPGSGIGLSLTRSLAEFHKGNIDYDHTSDGKNRFTLKLPIEQEGAYQFDLPVQAKESKEPVAPTPSKSNRPLILIVEDQPDMRQFIREELSATYDILEAEHGKAALHLLRSNNIQAIISDVMMPVMDGFELCNKVKNNLNYSHIPFILLTAQHNLQSRLEGLNKGADAYLEKPFSLELLNAQIDNLLKSREILSRAYIEKPTTPTSSLAVSTIDDIFLSKLNDYINQNLTNESLSVEAIASEMGMSTSSLYRKVKGLSGLSPVDFIRIARLKKAVELMSTGEKRINEIAYQVGFSSPAYFSTCFQKQYGKSPSEYMKENK